MAGIIAYGAYIPYYRMPRGVIGKAWGRGGARGEKAVANFDEDSITMSVAAGMDCLKGTDPKVVDAIYFATTTAPYKERLNATIIATALDFRPNIQSADFANCLRAGATALSAALDAVKAGSSRKVLVTASDTRQGAASGENEMAFGDGAAALLIGNDDVAVEVEGMYTISEDLADNWRAHDDQFVRSWEERFGREEGYLKHPIQAVTGLMKQVKLTQKDIAKVCIYGSSGRNAATLAGMMKFAPEQVQDPLLDSVGNTGVAQPMMAFVAALEGAKPGDRILMVTYGNGSDAILFRATDKIANIKNRRAIKRHLAIKRNLESYETYLRWRGLVPMEPSPRPPTPPVSMSSLWREHRSAMPLYGVKCKKCGTAQLFMSASSTRPRICLECQAKDEFEPVRFSDKVGKVASFSHDYLALSQDPPNTLTVVDYEGGGRCDYLMTDRDPTECKVGMMVEMTFRKVFFENGVHNYFWKCKPLRD